MVGGAGAPGGGACQGLRLLCRCPRSVRLSRPFWAPGLVRSSLWSLTQSSHSGSLRTVHTSSVPWSGWRLGSVLVSSSVCPVLLAGASLQLPLTGGRGQTGGTGPSKEGGAILGLR